MCVYPPLQLLVSLSDCLTFCLPLSVPLPQTNCTSVWSSIHLSPPSVPPVKPTPHLVSPSVCLSVRNERNLQQKQQLAGGPVSHDALHGARRAPNAPHLAFLLCRELNNHICIHRHTSNLYRPACGRGMDNDSHRCINSPQ